MIFFRIFLVFSGILPILSQALRRTAHVFFDKNITLRYLLIVVVIKYSLLNPRWRKPEVEVVQNRQLYMNSILWIIILKLRMFSIVWPMYCCLVEVDR